MSTELVKAIKKRRKTWGKLPVPSSRADLYWGTKQPELAKITDGQLTALLLSTPEFEQVIGKTLNRIDQRNRTIGNKKTMGRPARWSAWQLESVLLYRRIAGLENVKRTLLTLTADFEGRQLLDLGERLPSAPTITRYVRQHFDQGERVALYRELDRQLRERIVQLPGFNEEARIMGMDGSQHGTRYTAPIPEVDSEGERTGRIVNAEKQPGEAGAITAPTAGYVGGHHPKSGRGWQMLGLFTEHGTPVAWDISPLNEAEVDAAKRVLLSYASEIKEHRDPETLSVCTADAGFSSNVLREQLQALNVVPNIHRASHKKDYLQQDEETENASKRNRKWRPFRHPSKTHYENWGANGHGEISCSCGEGVPKREFPARKTGGAVPVTKGHCPTCGDVTITSGQWKLSTNKKTLVRCYRGDTPDPLIGNSLTFNDPLSREYGQDRYGFGESVHATIERRFGLLKDQSWMRDMTEVEIEFAIAMSAISVLLLERDAQRQASTPTPISGALSTPASLPLAA
jgi:hypothetical protein